MNTTQQHISIVDIQNDILLLKDGGGALILQVSAVNFGLLSDREQVAIIGSFAQTLNSLSFSIQIVIHSERLNISSYLVLLNKAQQAQTNPLLSQLITEYKQFIQATIKENEVLDKRFYVVIPLFAIELGLNVSKTSLEQKIKTVLLPRRDQVIRQLARVGLKATQLPKDKLIELFYNIYNGEILEKEVVQPINPAELAVKLNPPQKPAPPPQRPTVSQPTPQPPPNAPQAPTTTQTARTHPFVVEELQE